MQSWRERSAEQGRQRPEGNDPTTDLNPEGREPAGLGGPTQRGGTRRGPTQNNTQTDMCLRTFRHKTRGATGVRLF